MTATGLLLFLRVTVDREHARGQAAKERGTSAETLA